MSLQTSVPLCRFNGKGQIAVKRHNSTLLVYMLYLKLWRGIVSDR